MHVLIVDDDVRIRRLLRDAFEADGAAACEAGSVGEMRRRIRARRPDLVTLDIGLPDEDGLVALGDLRGQEGLPVILISGRDATADIVQGLTVGADDYVAKPFDPREVVARARAVHRRSANAGEAEAEMLSFDGWTVDPTRRDLYRPDGTPVELTATQFDLLRALVARPGIPRSRDELRAALGRPAGGYEDRSLDMQIRRLRARIEPDPEAPRFIKTARGLGYLFAAPVVVVSRT
jgi:DNA-binding response OmpR family regulator